MDRRARSIRSSAGARRLIERARKVTITKRGAFAQRRHHHQYEGIILHPSRPGVDGTALTAMYMPRRPSIRTLMEEKGEKAGCVGDRFRPIDMLVQGDVYVADVYGKIEQAGHRRQPWRLRFTPSRAMAWYTMQPFVTWTVFRRSAVHQLCVRAGTPPYASPTIMLMGRQSPDSHWASDGDARRCGVGAAGWRGLYPRPPRGKGGQDFGIVQLRDRFWQTTPERRHLHLGQIDTRWIDEIEQDFSGWLEEHIDESPALQRGDPGVVEGTTWRESA